MGTNKKENNIQLNYDTTWSYDPAPENSSHISLQKKYELFINGQFRPPIEGKYFITKNPATGRKIASISKATGEDVDLAVKAAQKARSKWINLPAKERGKYLFRIARAIQEKAREFAVIESLDGGKPIRESKTVDVPLAAAHFFFITPVGPINYRTPFRVESRSP